MKKTLKPVLTSLLLLSVCSCGAQTNVEKLPGLDEMNNKEYLDKYTYINTTNEDPLRGKTGVKQAADPYVFYEEAEDCYYMTSTYNGKVFYLSKSKDLTNWQRVNSILALEDVSWRSTDQTSGLWGPEIHKINGKYYLYFSAWEANANTPRIGVATSDKVEGPYVVKNTPLFDFGYSAIDNHLFKDTDGKYYFYYCKDATDNIINDVHTSEIWCVPMGDDFVSTKPESEAVRLLGPDKEWEVKSGGVTWAWTEGCWMQKHEDKYYLFYSANKYSEPAYAIGYAVSDSPMGTFTKLIDDPLIYTCADIFSGPGNNSFFYSKDGKELMTAYHMHIDPNKPSGYRYLNIDRIGFREDGTVYFCGPTATNQPIPSGTVAHHTLLNDKATVEAPAALEGFSNGSALVDGEIVVLDKNSKYEYVSSTTPEETAITIKFDSKQVVNSLYLYNATSHFYQSSQVKIEFSDGTVIDSLKLSTTPGEAAIVNIAGVNCEWIKITTAEKGFGQTYFGLSEVMIFGE